MTWHLLANACELAQPGDFVVLPWRAHEEIALTNIDGRIVAFDNRCPHRGARIFTEPNGNRPPACPYHGRMAREGQLRTYSVAMVGGFVFCSRSKVGLPDLDDLMFGFLETPQALQLHSTFAFTMDCDWRIAVDNALDLEHVEHVHADSLAKLKLSRADVRAYLDGSSMEVFRSGESARLDAVASRFPSSQLFDYIHAHFFPFACLSSTRGWSYSLQHYFPRPDGRTNFIHRMYVQPAGPKWFHDSAAKLNEQVFREDADICAGIPADFKADYGPRDDRVRHFRSRL